MSEPNQPSQSSAFAPAGTSCHALAPWYHHPADAQGPSRPLPHQPTSIKYGTACSRRSASPRCAAPAGPHACLRPGRPIYALIPRRGPAHRPCNAAHTRSWRRCARGVQRASLGEFRQKGEWQTHRKDAIMPHWVLSMALSGPLAAFYENQHAAFTKNDTVAQSLLERDAAGKWPMRRMGVTGASMRRIREWTGCRRRAPERTARTLRIVGGSLCSCVGIFFTQASGV